MPIGRDAVLERLGAMLEGARSGRGAARVVRGGPGLGKTEMASWARAAAGGWRVLAATGVESEAELPFAVLGDLLRPVLHLRAGLPRQRRRALDAALALGPATVADRFAAYAGAFALVEAAAREEGPVLMLVDDAQWLDAPSAEAVAFIARRLEDVPVALLIGQRPGEGIEFLPPGADVIDLEPLGDADARALLATSADGALDPGVARRLLAAAAGNPLALVELPGTLDAEERAGRVPLPEPLRLGRVIGHAFRRRLERLDGEARRAVTVAAAGAGDPAATVLDACAHAGCATAALERAEAAGVLEIRPGRIVFCHPLLRAVALRLTPVEELRAAHRALAAASPDDGPAEGRAWHLAGAAVGADEPAAEALEQAAAGAVARTAYATATEALARAADLTPDPGERARRLLRAAEVARLSGRMSLAVGLAERAAAIASDPLFAAEVDHLRGMLRVSTGPVEDGVRLLLGSAARVSGRSPGRAALMLADSSIALAMAGHPAMCLVSCERALELGPREPDVRATIELATANALHQIGRGREVAEQLDHLAAVTAALDPLTAPYPVLAGIGVQMLAGRHAEAWRLSGDATAASRRAGALGPLALILAVRADLAFRTADWPESLASAEEAAGRAEETGQAPIAAFALALLARTEGACGREADARRRLEAAAGLARAAGAPALDIWTGHARGLLELGLGRHAAAIDALAPVARLWESEGARSPDVIPWRHDLVEALARAGRADEARATLRGLAEEAGRSGGATALAVTARCRGLLDAGYARHFEEALRLHGPGGVPFEEARTRLCYGERLRRDRRRGRAREQLARALDAFEALGARPWADRARDELAAAGAPPAGPGPPGAEALTPRELQVALAVARGATNREAARALFTSEKTVERHLSSVYAKLGLRSRSELARRIARG